MKTIKGNKKDLKKEYRNYLKDLNIQDSQKSRMRFIIDYTNMYIKFYGIYTNNFFKTLDFEKIQNELILVLKEK